MIPKSTSKGALAAQLLAGMHSTVALQIVSTEQKPTSFFFNVPA